jgi:hypothetical protein
MNPTTLKETLIKTIEAGLPVMIKGAPGIGKTDIVKQAAEETKYQLIISHPVVSDPTDYKGLPGIVDGEAEFLPFGDLRILMETKRDTICFLDDLGQAPAVVQAAAMQLILARQINGHKISDKVVFIAATNRRQDRAGVTAILEPVKSRFATILELQADLDSWIDWALDNDMPAELIGFIRWKPDLLSAHVATADITNSPCPRTIAYAGKLLEAGLDSQEVLAGAIGEGAAAELVGFLEIYKNLPNIQAILIDPENAPVPDAPASLYAVASALVRHTTENNAGQIMKYAMRLPADFSVFMVRDMTRKEPKVQHTKEYIKWGAKFSKHIS